VTDLPVTQASAERTRLLHELNNLLAVILSYTELVAQALPADHEVRPDLAEIERASQRAAEVIALLADGR